MRSRPYVAVLASFTLSAMAFALPIPAQAQGGELNIPSFTHLQRQATDTVDITLGSLPLHFAGALIDDQDADNADVKAVLSGLKSVRVRSYKFDADFVYSKSDVDAVRAQLTGPGWSQLVQTRDRKDNKAVDIYLAMDHEKISGLAIVTSEPREFTIVNIVGSVTPEQASKLQKHFSATGLNSLAQLAP